MVLSAPAATRSNKLAEQLAAGGELGAQEAPSRIRISSSSSSAAAPPPSTRAARRPAASTRRLRALLDATPGETAADRPSSSLPDQPLLARPIERRGQRLEKRLVQLDVERGGAPCCTDTCPPTRPRATRCCTRSAASPPRPRARRHPHCRSRTVVPENCHGHAAIAARLAVLGQRRKAGHALDHRPSSVAPNAWRAYSFA